jgi:hypothetical protein
MARTETCGWCELPLDACTRCRECGAHGSIVDGACGICGAVPAYRPPAVTQLDTTVHVSLDALDAQRAVAALEVAIASGEIHADALRDLLAAVRDGAIAAGVPTPASILRGGAR